MNLCRFRKGTARFRLKIHSMHSKYFCNVLSAEILRIAFIGDSRSITKSTAQSF